ncbi:MAG: leucyl aminopeptidase family protein [Bacteroidota bacterium]
MKISQNQNLGAQINILPFRKGKVNTSSIQSLSGIQSEILFEGGFKEVKTLHHPSENRIVYLIGLGEEKHESKTYLAARSLAHNHHKGWTAGVNIECGHLVSQTVEQLIIGFKLATYRIGRFKQENELPSFFDVDFTVNLVSDDDLSAVIESGSAKAEVMMQVMGLVDAPPNEKTPEYLGNWVKGSAQKYGYEADILDADALKKEGLEALLSVGQGSKYPPVLIKTEYKPKGSVSNTPKLGLVGKGITFDTGGLSIKGSQNLHYMKSDMGGGAAVLGAVELATRLQLDIHIVGIIACAENAVDANSYRPGDVINSYSGKTIEVIDTDAEGRLALADALAYMQKNYAPELMIDLATLTGSSVMTLGYSAGALFSNDDELADIISESGYQVDERVWRLPLFEDFEKDLESDLADVRNFSGKPVAGAITAAKFLQYFVNDQVKWAHLDIAGVAFGDSEFSKMKSAKGYGPRLLIEIMNKLKNHVK